MSQKQLEGVGPAIEIAGVRVLSDALAQSGIDVSGFPAAAGVDLAVRFEAGKITAPGWQIEVPGLPPVVVAREGEGFVATEAGMAMNRMTLRMLMAEHLYSAGGLVVHASARAWGDEVYVFLGATGAGKSTVAAQAEGGALVADDTVVLLPRPGVGCDVFGTPFSSQASQVGAPLQGRLAGIVLLEQALTFELSELSRHRTLKRLFESLFLPPGQKSAGGAPLRTALQAASGANGYTLRFPLGHAFHPRQLDDALPLPQPGSPL